MRVQFWIKVNIENAMIKLGPKFSGRCVKSTTYSAVTSGTHTPQSVQEMTNIKSFEISILKQKTSWSIGDQP